MKAMVFMRRSFRGASSSRGTVIGDFVLQFIEIFRELARRMNAEYFAF